MTRELKGSLSRRMEVEWESLVRVTSIGGMWLRASRVGMGVVQNAPVTRRRPCSGRILDVSRG